MPPVIFYIILGIFSIWLSALTYYFLRSKSPVTQVISPGSVNGWRFSLVRFNPFSDTGGEQSFVLSLLNPSGSGILITSLHGRGVTRLYAKEVNHGKADTELSAEEKQALSQALNTHV